LCALASSSCSTKPARAVSPYLSPICWQCGRQTSPCSRRIFAIIRAAQADSRATARRTSNASQRRTIKPRMAEYYSKLAETEEAKHTSARE
jgi:hypothetical protein